MNKFFILAFMVLLSMGLCTTTSPAAAKIIVFTNVNVVPMTSETVLQNQAVIVEGTKISAIVPSSGYRAPADAEIIDCHNAYLMPGLADMHTHVNDALFTHPCFNLFLANGVTSIRDLTYLSPPTVLAYRREIEAGTRLGPHIYTANTYRGTGTNDVEVFQAQQSLGYDAAKLKSFFSPEDFTAIMERAKQSDVYTIGHIPYAVGLDGVLASGMNEVSHVDEVVISEMIGLDHGQKIGPDQWEIQKAAAFRQALLPFDGMPMDALQAEVSGRLKEIVLKLKAKDITFSTTLICDRDTVDKLFDREKIVSSAHAPYISPVFWNLLDSGRDVHQTMLPKEEWGIYKVYAELSEMLAVEMKRNGVNLVLGTDVGLPYVSYVPGFSVHDELEILTDIGFTPYEALLTATKNASDVASRMTGVNEFGTIEVGKRADLILVSDNPLNDLSCTRNPLGVMADGRWLPAETLAELLQVETTTIDERITFAYGAGGIDAAIEEYRAIKRDNLNNRYYLSEEVLNLIGYKLLEEGATDDAVKILELNTAEYPESANAFDSLGEAYLKLGDKQKAIEFYRQSLALNPANTNAIDALKNLLAN